MANESNLIVPSSEQAREYGRKGGKKKAENARKRKALKEELEILLEAIAEDGKTYQESISISLIKEAQKGNTKAYEVIRDTIGQKPKENVNISGEVNNPFSGMSTEELRKIANSE